MDFPPDLMIQSTSHHPKGDIMTRGEDDSEVTVSARRMVEKYQGLLG